MSNAPQNTLISPFDLTDDDGYTWVKGNLHSHTTNSDGQPSPQERLDGYVEHDYDYLCLSDHYKITRIDSVDCPDNFILIQGAELHPENPFGGQTHHFVVLNIHEDMDSKNMPPQHVIDEAIKQGGSVWLAHPHWSSVNIIRDTLPLQGLAGIEVFNTTCRRMGRGEGTIHWDDWMDLTDTLLPALANDDAHAKQETKRDTYEGWTMARVRERTADAVTDALEAGASYGSTGPEIHDIQLRRVDEVSDDKHVVEATVRSSEAQSVNAVCDTFGTEHRPGNGTFDQAVFTIRPNARWARFEVMGPDGSKAWSNPFDLTRVEHE